MATQLFLIADTTGPTCTFSRGDNSLSKLNGSTSAFTGMLLSTTRGTTANGVSRTTTSTVNGPTNGIEVVDPGPIPYEFLTEPLNADITISGTITCNLWTIENNMSANVSINVIIERVGPTGSIVSTIAQSARSVEAGTTLAAENFTVTPTSTNMKKGDRIRLRVYGDDAGTMAAGFTFGINFSGNTASAQGDSYITFTENLGFLTTAPSGSVLYLGDTSLSSLSAGGREMWTSRGSGVVSGIVNTAAGWTAPIQWTKTAGGTAMEWYSRPLSAFTLTDLVTCNIRALASAAGIHAVRCELAIVNNDGSGATVWASNGFKSSTLSTSETILTTESAMVVTLAGPSTAVTAGQRLRLRVFIDDTSTAAMSASQTCTLFYAGTSGGASGDTFITLNQTVTESANTYTKSGYAKENG